MDGMLTHILPENFMLRGDFDVSISIHEDYVVAASGILQSQINHNQKKTWRFKAEDVHDFVWAADPDYVHDILKVDSENLELHFYYQKSSDEMVQNWKNYKMILQKLSNL